MTLPTPREMDRGDPGGFAVRHPIVAAVALALASAAAAQVDPGPPPPAGQVDASPTPWSCTVDTLLSGDDCVFETEARASANPEQQALENARAAARLADRACARASRPALEPVADPSVLAACKKDFVERAMACGVDGTHPLLDGRGRFAPGMRICYYAMSEVLARAKFMAETSAGCCRCLVRSRCARSGEQCNRDVSRNELQGSKCIEGPCSDACRSFVPEPGPPQPPPGADAKCSDCPQQAPPPPPVIFYRLRV